MPAVKPIRTTLAQDGFAACLYQAPQPSDKGVIVLIGDDGGDAMNRWCARYLNTHGCHALGLGKWQDKSQPNGVSEWPLEYIERAACWLRARGIAKIGVMGGSMGGNMALAAASCIPEISLVAAFCPCDLVMEGAHEGKKDGMGEWCTGKSCYTWRGQPLPFHPYSLTPREYWDTYKRSSLAHRELRSVEIFRHAEEALTPAEECFLPVENIRGSVLLFAAEDDSMWETARYVRRLTQRLTRHGFAYPVQAHIYRYGTHFIFPQSLLTGALPVGGNLLPMLFASGRRHPKECRQSRLHVDAVLQKALAAW